MKRLSENREITITINLHIKYSFIAINIHKMVKHKLQHMLPLHKKWSFPLRISPANATKSAVSYVLVTFTGKILNGKFHFLCSKCCNAFNVCVINHFLIRVNKILKAIDKGKQTELTSLLFIYSSANIVSICSFSVLW